MSELWKDTRELYERSIEFATQISTNRAKLFDAKIKRADTRFVSKLSMAYRNFRSIATRYADKPLAATTKARKQEPVFVMTLPKDSGRLRLRSTLTTVNNERCKTRVGQRASIPHGSALTPPPLSSKLGHKKLPLVSLINGKVSPIQELPSFSDFHKITSATHEGVLSKLESLSKQISDLPKKLNGLETLEKPHTAEKNAFSRSENLDSPDADLSKKPRDKSPEQIFNACSNLFKEAQQRQNQQIINILDRMDRERPFVLHEKFRIVSNDADYFKAGSRFNFSTINKSLETGRSSRMKKARDQTDTYNGLLSYLKNKENSPSKAEMNFVDRVKDLLEEGWPIDEDLVKKLCEQFNEKERIDIQPLVNLIYAQLEIKRTDQTY